MWQNIILSLIERTYPSTADLRVFISSHLKGFSLVMHTQGSSLLLKTLIRLFRKMLMLHYLKRNNSGEKSCD